MTQDEAMVARDVRRHLEKRAVDATMVQIYVHKGFVTVTGQVRRLRSQPLADLKEEIEIFRKTVLRQMNQVDQLILEWRVIDPPKEKKEHAQADTQTGGSPGLHKT